MIRTEIRPLRVEDDRSDFRSGDPDLDRFFARYAGQNQFRHHVGTTYVPVEAERILGFVTVSAGHVEVDRLPERTRKGLPRYPLPILRLARLAVDHRAIGRGIGQALLRFALRLALEMTDRVGCVGVWVDAKPGAGGFYSRLGFEDLSIESGSLEDRPAPTPMFLPIGSVPRI